MPATKPAPKKTWPNPFDNPCELVTTTERAIEILRSFKDLPKPPACDTETEVVYGPDGKALGPDPLQSRIAVASFACRRDLSKGPEHDEAYVFFLRDMDKPALVAALDELLLEFYGWNAGFDDPVVSCGLRQSWGEIGWKFRPLVAWRDLMLGESIRRLGREGHVWHESLAGAAKKFLGIDIEGKGTVQLSYKVNEPLDQEQIQYAASDALVTLWLSDIIEPALQADRLWGTYERGIRSRVIWQEMEIVGFPYAKDAWLAWLKEDVDRTLKEVEDGLADLTPGDVQEDLFEGLHLQWKPGSEKDVPRILNKYAPDEVMRYTAEWIDGNGQAPDVNAEDDLDDEDEDTPKRTGRLLTEGESVDKTALALMGGDLAKLITEWRKVSKMWTTYGPRWTKFVAEDGRVHAEYTQAIVATNRASSKNPNAQNEQKAQKAYMRNENPFWVMIAADFSQAELRAMAQLWNETSMIEAFAAGQDQHEATAAAMFKLDMKALKAAGEAGDLEKKAVYVASRGKAKGIAFGLPYGMRGKRLAISMTVNGNKTSASEADELIEAFLNAKPGIKKGLEERDAYVQRIADDVMEGKYDFDWEATWQLLDLHPKVAASIKTLRARGVKGADSMTIAEEIDSRSAVEGKLAEQLKRQPTPDEVDAEMAGRAEAVAWAQGFLSPVVLLKDGSIFSFEGRSAADDRRLFEVSGDLWMQSMAMKAVKSRRPGPVAITKAWAERHKVKLFQLDPESGQERLVGAGKLKKIFEARALRKSYVQWVLQQMPTAVEFLARAGVADQVRGKGNQYRNVPVQSIVASVVQRAMWQWNEVRHTTPSARMIKSVHDSLVAECDIREARATLQLLKDTMEAALREWCPDVKCVADADVQLNYSEKSIVPLDELDAKIAEVLAAYEAAVTGEDPVEAERWRLWKEEADERLSYKLRPAEDLRLTA